LLLALVLAAGFALLWVLHPLPEELLEPRSGSPAVYDREGRPLLILTDENGEWRLPVELSATGPWIAKATVAVEDHRFYRHAGVDLASVLRAVGQNVSAGRVVSGASTITMQLCRLLDPRPRDLAAKVSEAIRALKLERRLEKDEILELYLNLAPYGGNVVGVEAAARIWFGKSAADLSLPEAALLAGLPQSPTRYRPDLHPDRAMVRRRQVLTRMLEEGVIDRTAFERAEAAPVRVRPLAAAGRRLSAGTGRHAAWWALAERPRGGRTALDKDLQALVEPLARAHATGLPPGSDVAVVVLEIATGEVRALVGSAEYADPVDGQVNGALALRSPGSALKPFVYAAAFATGRLGPDSSVPDRPIDRGGWRPRNFRPGFAGEVKAAEALRRSLNLPAMRTLEAVGLTRCVGTMRAAGLPLPEGTEARAGLALATGAVEVRLLDLVNAYATIGRGGTFRPARLFPGGEPEPRPDSPGAEPEARRALPESACREIDRVLSCRARPPKGLEGMRPEDVRWFMWKTGTSSGRRDAWAVGHNRRFAVGVWAGQFAGFGHVEYTGEEAAEPLLARLFQHPRMAGPEGDPAPPPARKVPRPLFAPGRRETPRILSPAPDSVFLAVRGVAVIRPEGNLGGDGTWFLNEEPLPADRAARLVLAPGRYELRLAGPGGGGDAVTIEVLER
jgi:penicillin-binding protein 1C